MDDLSNPDIFFYHQEIDKFLQIKSELVWGISQSKRSMFFNRSEGAGVAGKENHPNSLQLEIDIKYSIVSNVARKNQFVTDGTNGTDRRIAVSWTTVGVERSNTGNIDVSVYYIPYGDYKRQENVSVPL